MDPSARAVALLGLAGLALALVLPPPASAGSVALSPHPIPPLCHTSTPAGVICLFNATKIHPTQTSVGMLEIADKVKKLDGKTQKKLTKYLRHHTVPIVIGPYGQYFITDHHHLTYAFLKSNKEFAANNLMYGEIQCDWSKKSVSSFWNAMEAQKWVWLKNGAGREIEPAQLPKKVLSMTDDPYRSLSYKVRYVGFNKTCVPFAEFEWGNYYRTGCCPGLVQNCPFSYVLDEVVNATFASRESEAKNLPGYVPPFHSVSTKKPDCKIALCPA